MRLSERVLPAARPLRGLPDEELWRLLADAVARANGLTGAHCIHELCMRGAVPAHIERALEQLWSRASGSIPDWLPMRFVHFLPELYEIAGRFRARARGRSNVYLVLLDYADRPGDPFGVYIGMSDYAPALRFDQHKAGIRASGAVLKRGLELLSGPTLHLRNLSRAEAARIEAELAAALADAGLRVAGGH